MLVVEKKGGARGPLGPSPKSAYGYELYLKALHELYRFVFEILQGKLVFFVVLSS